MIEKYIIRAGSKSIPRSLFFGLNLCMGKKKLDKPTGGTFSRLEFVCIRQGCYLGDICHRDARNVSRWSALSCGSLTWFAVPEGTKNPPLGGTRPRRKGKCSISSGDSFWFAPKSRPRWSLSRHSGSRRRRGSVSSIGRSMTSPFTAQKVDQT
jgi:hypothetical protein